MAGKVVGLGFEIISNLDSYFLMTIIAQILTIVGSLFIGQRLGSLHTEEK